VTVSTPFGSLGQSSIGGFPVYILPGVSLGQSSIGPVTVSTPFGSLGQSSLFSMPMGTVMAR
jgi:hypothetical protein